MTPASEGAVLPRRLAAAAGASGFARRIDGLINASPKTQRQIAREMGYANSNIVTMFKRGTTRVPLDRVPALASTLGVDPVELLRLWLKEYEPQMVAIIERHFGAFLSAREREWTDGLRRRPVEGQPPPPAAYNDRGTEA